MAFIEDMVDKDTKVRIFILADERRVELTMQDLEDIFSGYRPRLMSHEDFRYVSGVLKKELKEYMREGKLFHLSKVSNELWKEYYEKGAIKTYRQRGHTYVKRSKESRDSENK
jgi:hypothetical protein